MNANCGLIVVNAHSSPSTDWDRRESPPGFIAPLMQSAGVPIDRYSFETVETMKDRAAIWGWRRELLVARARLAGATEAQARASVPKVDLKVLDVSFDAIPNREEREYFLISDRPVRMAGHVTMSSYLDEWTAAAGPNNLAEDPPNATLSVYEGGKSESTLAVVEISEPDIEGNDLVYRYKLIDGTMPKAGGAAALFIDWIGLGGGVGPGWNRPQDAVYPLSQKDGNGDDYNGAKHELLAAGQLLWGNTKFSIDSGTSPGLGSDDGGYAVGSDGWFPGGGFLSYSVSPDLKLGFAMTGNFGAGLNYDDNWVGRYYVQETTILGISFLPSIAYRVNDKLSVGASLNAMYGT